jgi:hypothetical protein
MHQDFPLSKDGASKGGALGLGIAPSLMSLGGSSSKAEAAGPRIKLELEFLPYW